MCVLSIKVHIRKKSGNLFNDHRICTVVFISIFLFWFSYFSFSPYVGIAIIGCCIRLSLLFLMLSLNCIYLILNTSIWCKVLWIVFNFLVLWTICLSSSLVYFKNGTKYLTRVTAKIVVPRMRFLLYILVSVDFLVIPKNSSAFSISWNL